jgi:hypothetical protein
LDPNICGRQEEAVMGFGHRNWKHQRGQQITAEKFNTFIDSYRKIQQDALFGS